MGRWVSTCWGEKILVFYYCKECKKLNGFVHPIMAAASVKDSSTAFGEIRANAAISDAIEKKREKIREEDEGLVYRTARYKHVCECCGSRAPWARLDFRVFDNIAKVGLAALLIVLLRAVFGAVIIENASLESELLNLLPCLIGAIALLVVPLLIKFIKRAKTEAEIDKLEGTYLPWVCWEENDIESVQKELARINPTNIDQ